MYQVDSEDANFFFLEQADSPTHISLIYLYDQSSLGDDTVRFTHIRDHIGNRLNLAPVFRQKIQRTPADIDLPYWVDDAEFDLDFHVRHLALPKPGDWRQFCIQISRLHSRPLDMSRPLWELYVIEGLDNVEKYPEGCFAIYFKIHHCAMDEFTAQELMESLHSTLASRRQHESSDQHIEYLPASAPRPAEMVFRGLVNNSVRVARLSWQSVSNARTFGKVAARFAIGIARRVVDREQKGNRGATRFDGPLGQSRVFEGAFYSRELLDRYVALVPGASLTHAILAICGETMRLYLDGHGELGEEQLKGLLEINVRNAGAHALIGNHIAINQVELHTSVIYPEGRLQAIYAAERELHSTENEELTTVRLRSLYENLPAPVLAWLGRTANSKNSLNHRVLEGANLGVAELRGSDSPLYLLGARLLGCTGISPLYSGCGLMFTASTYDDGVGITFTSDRSMVPDPEFMRQCLDDSVQQIDDYLKTKHKNNKARRKKRHARPAA